MNHHDNTEFKAIFDNIREVDKLNTAGFNAEQIDNFNAIRARLNADLISIAEINQKLSHETNPAEKEKMAQEKETFKGGIASTLRETANVKKGRPLVNPYIIAARDIDTRVSSSLLRGVAGTVTKAATRHEMPTDPERIQIETLAAILTGETHERFSAFDATVRNFINGKGSSTFIKHFKTTFPSGKPERGEESKVSDFFTTMRDEVDYLKFNEKITQDQTK